MPMVRSRDAAPVGSSATVVIGTSGLTDADYTESDRQVHSVRIPGFVIAFETLFGLPDERLTIRHDAGSSAEPYTAGTLLAIREVVGRTGLVRGLDTLLFG